jgi:hypothetical protein
MLLPHLKAIRISVSRRKPKSYPRRHGMQSTLYPRYKQSEI